MADTYRTSESTEHVIERLKREKRNAKATLTRERNKLHELVSAGNETKNTVWQYIRKIKSKFIIIIVKLLKKLKGIFIFENIVESEAEVEKISKEIEEISTQVDTTIEEAESHVKERLEGGEPESSVASSTTSSSTHLEYESQELSDIEEAKKRALEQKNCKGRKICVRRLQNLN